jgi:hypothetical protein
MHCSRLLLAGGLTLLIAGPAAAQEFKPPASFFIQSKQPTPKPPRIDWNWRPSADETSGAKATVVCGMTLVPGNPNIDPGMRVTAPSSGVFYTLRTSPPTICKGQ